MQPMQMQNNPMNPQFMPQMNSNTNMNKQNLVNKVFDECMQM